MLYLIYDSALDTPYTFLILRKYYENNISLFKGTKDEAIMDASPWLFLIDEQLETNFNKEPGASIGPVLFMESDSTLEDIALHFRQYLYQTVEGREYFFRFWDSRVLKKFLPTCTKQQLMEFFGPVEYFMIPGDNAEDATQFRQERGVLKQKKINVQHT